MGSASNYGAEETSNVGIYTFDASTQVPTAPEVRPVSYALLECIKYTLGL